MDTAILPESREALAMALCREHGEEIRAIEPCVYEVPSSNGYDRYIVTYGDGELETCQCPDFEHRVGPDGGVCYHIIAVGLKHAAQRHPRACACNRGWGSMGVETEDGSEEVVLYPCRRCRPIRPAPVEQVISAGGDPFTGAFGIGG